MLMLFTLRSVSWFMYARWLLTLALVARYSLIVSYYVDCLFCRQDLLSKLKSQKTQMGSRKRLALPFINMKCPCLTP